MTNEVKEKLKKIITTYKEDINEGKHYPLIFEKCKDYKVAGELAKLLLDKGKEIIPISRSNCIIHDAIVTLLDDNTFSDGFISAEGIVVDEMLYLSPSELAAIADLIGLKVYTLSAGTVHDFVIALRTLSLSDIIDRLNLELGLDGRDKLTSGDFMLWI